MSDACATVGPVEPSLTLIAEATRRSGVLWVSAGPDASGTPTLVWHLWHGDAAYVVCRGDEQPLPSLGPVARVSVRSTSGQRVVEWTAQVSEIVPGTEPWDEVTPLLAAERLNAPSAAGLAERWATSSTVLRLTPLRLDRGPTGVEGG